MCGNQWGKLPNLQAKRHWPRNLMFRYGFNTPTSTLGGIVQHPVPILEGNQGVITAGHEQNISLRLVVFITVSSQWKENTKRMHALQAHQPTLFPRELSSQTIGYQRRDDPFAWTNPNLSDADLDQEWTVAILYLEVPSRIQAHPMNCDELQVSGLRGQRRGNSSARLTVIIDDKRCTGRGEEQQA